MEGFFFSFCGIKWLKNFNNLFFKSLVLFPCKTIWFQYFILGEGSSFITFPIPFMGNGRFLSLLNSLSVIIFSWRIMHFTQVWLLSPYLILGICAFSPCPFPKTKLTNGWSISYFFPKEQIWIYSFVLPFSIFIFTTVCFYLYYFLPLAFLKLVFSFLLELLASFIFSFPGLLI